jgi:hypothetical protein
MDNWASVHPSSSPTCVTRSSTVHVHDHETVNGRKSY